MMGINNVSTLFKVQTEKKNCVSQHVVPFLVLQKHGSTKTVFFIEALPLTARGKKPCLCRCGGDQSR